MRIQLSLAQKPSQKQEPARVGQVDQYARAIEFGSQIGGEFIYGRAVVSAVRI
jgi:hypothetical protein